MKSTLKVAYSRIERSKLRLLAALKQRPRIIFIHVPKSAGTTVRAHLRACLGSNASGSAVRIHNVPFKASYDKFDLDKARTARLVHGHLSWDSVERIGRDDAFLFTFLRSPQARLKSLYCGLSTYTNEVKSEHLRNIAKICKGLQPEEIARSTHPMIRSYADNYLVRQFSGSIDRYPVPESEWPNLLERARINLQSLDFIGRQEAFDEDFARLLPEIGLPAHNRAKVNSSGSAKAQIPIDPALYRWDTKLLQAVLN